MKENKFYQKLSKYYDDFVGDVILEKYKEMLGEVKGKRMLDLGCGTGTLLSIYSSKNDTYGIDESVEMIKVAKKKDKKTTYSIGDIIKFNFKEQFDIITCAFDTINHLKKIKDWESLFQSVKGNLSEKGLFIFDFNSLKGFKLHDGNVIFKEIRGNFLLMYTKVQGNECSWVINIFEKKSKSLYKREKIITREWSYKNDVIFNSLKKHFSKFKYVENKDSSRVYVEAQK